MKRLKIKYLLISLLVTAARFLAMSQQMPGETAFVFTDRETYIAGEIVLFSALVMNDAEVSTDLSKVLYCELITPAGLRLTAEKFLLENSRTFGSLQIPEDAITGYYYLKAYTKWMRNGGPGTYEYILLRVINPYRSELLNGSNHQGDFQPVSDEKPGLALITVSKSIYRPGEEVVLDVSYPDEVSVMALSVAPAFPRDSIPFRRDSISFLRDSISAETRGLSISGKLTDKMSGKPVPNSLVNLSVIGENDASAIRTDETGRFNFSLPSITGKHDIFLCSEDIPGVQTEIMADNDFCTYPLYLSAPKFSLDESEKETIIKMAANQKMASVFLRNTRIRDTIARNPVKPFYGSPDEVLIMDKFIDLPGMEEYFSELLGNVNVRKNEDRKVFRFNSTRTEMLIYDPLVLIDWVAVNDVEKVLAIPPRQIERIELVNSPYVKGNITYGGIISLFSKNRDFAGIDLPSSGTFINYQFLSDPEIGKISGPPSAGLPDARNTVYWNPELKPENDEKIHFTAPATPGRYAAVLSYIDDLGEKNYSRIEFDVIKR